METLSLKTVRRRKKKILYVNKDLVSGNASGGQPAISVKKSSNKTRVPRPKKPLSTKKPRRQPPAPAILNEKRIKRIVALCENYPTVFSIENPKPLAIDISEQLINQPDCLLSKKTIRSGIKHYTNLPQYHRAVVAREKRIDLNGERGEVPEEEHVKHACAKLERWDVLPSRWKSHFREIVDSYPGLFVI